MTKRKLPEDWTRWRRANYEFFLKHIDPMPRHLTFVDLGAGALHFKDLFGQFKYVGVDFKPYPGVTIVADLTKDVPIDSGTADIVMLSNTLEHIPNTGHLLQECRRIVKDGGTIVGTIPFLMRAHQMPFDFNRYTSVQLRNFLSDAGFSDVHIEPLGKLVDTYETIEVKFFSDLGQRYGKYTLRGILLRLLRSGRRFGTKIIRLLSKTMPASETMTEGFGFIAKAR